MANIIDLAFYRTYGVVLLIDENDETMKKVRRTKTVAKRKMTKELNNV